MSRGASRIAAQKVCPGLETDGGVTILKPDGAVLSEWSSADFPGDLSPDGRSMLATQPEVSDDGDEYAVIRDTMTGKVTKKLKLDLLSEPSDAIGHAWLTDDEGEMIGRGTGTFMRSHIALSSLAGYAPA